MAVSNSIDRFNGVLADKAIKVPCAVATSVDILLSGPQTIDAVGVVTGDRVLVRAQTNAAENGIYNVLGAAWERAADWDGNRDITHGTLASAFNSSNELLLYVVSTADPITIGSTLIVIDLYDFGGVTLPVGTLVDTTLRYNGIDLWVENVNFLAEASGRVTLPNDIPIRWDAVNGSPKELLSYRQVDTTPNGGVSIVLNFEGTDGDRFYTDENGRDWTFAGSTGINDISNAQAKFGSTSYDFGGQGAQDDHIFTDITTQYDGLNFVMGVKNWFIRQWIWNDTTQVGGHDYGCIGGTTGGTRAFRWSNNNNTVSLAYDGSANGSEDTFPTFGAAPTDGAWHEFVWERFGDGIYFYLDGVQQGATFDCTGDDIGAGLIAATKVLMLGSSIQNAVAGVTPVANSYMDAFEMVIGRSLNGGIAPGSPSTSAPAPQADTETFQIGRFGERIELIGFPFSIHGAYDLPIFDGTTGQVLTTDGDGRVTFETAAAPAGIADGNVTNAILRWDGADWVENTDILAISAGATTWEVRGSGAFLHLHTTGAAADEKETRIKMDNFAGFAIQSVTDGGSNGPFLLTANRTGSAWQHLQISVNMDIFGSLYLDDAAGVQPDTLTHGQIYVDSADDSLHYRTGAGVDTDLTAAGGVTTFAALTDTNVGTVVDHSMLFYDLAGTEWKDTAGLLLWDGDGATVGMVINDVVGGKDGALLIQNGANALQGLSLSTNVASGYCIIQTPILGNTELWLSAENGGENIVLKALAVRIAGGVPSVDFVDFIDDDTDFNTVAGSKVDWNINGFSGSIRIIGMDLNVGDNDLITLGTGDDCSIFYDTNDLHIGVTGGSVMFDNAVAFESAVDTVAANAVTLLMEDGNGFEVDLEPATAAVVITLSGGPPTGSYYAASLKVQQDGATAQTISFAGGVIVNADGVQHPVTTTLDGISIYTLETWDGGTTWYISGVDYS